MNAERLLDGFSLLGDAPETVQQLRKLVVALAVAGKLKSTGEATTDVATLMKLIEDRMRELSQKGQLPKQNPAAKVTAEDLPKAFSSPENFVRLGSIARIEKGLTGIMKAQPGPYPLVVTAEDRAGCDHFDFDGAAAIVPLVSSAGHGKASLQRLHYQEGKFALGSILAAIFPHVPDLFSARFLFEYLTAFKEELLVSQMIGTANVSLSLGKVSDVPVPLISPSVQRKVDELMALCDRLEAVRAEREATRDRLTASSLARLNAPDPETFRDDARFALDALSALTTRPDQIKRLRQTILSLAVRGKLAPQDPNDEPASDLLAEKAKLPDEYRRRRKILKKTSVEAPKHLFPPIPASWTYTDIQTLYDLNALIDYADGNHGSLYPRSGEFGDSGIPFVTAKDLVHGRVLWDSCAKLNPERASQLTKGWAQGGDVLLTHNATVGRVARVEHGVGSFLLGTSVTFYRLNSQIINPEFFFVVLCSPLWQGQLEEIMAQTTRNQVSIQKQAFFKVVVPPVAEQCRIVVKVDELMTFCDQLEASLATADAIRRRLLDALLAEALVPDDERDLEAAE